MSGLWDYLVGFLYFYNLYAALHAHGYQEQLPCKQSQFVIALRTITIISLFANNIENRIDQLSALNVVTFGPIKNKKKKQNKNAPKEMLHRMGC
ncbi:hypothetical protein HYC85_013345 [Camellia sinensis]|uniref:Uncharacterized protein n=1 Tax=Camellia sinensis TaxID=4442 RepID=A0A7J7H6P5_CAMSI|nr:hypothetical protein HYC85_013345 [Camellia sinensis]